MHNRTFGILNGNHLKLIAAFTMLVDHVGALMFPQVLFLRILGRISYPIFAFMIAEGCRYTKNRLRYFLMVFGLGVICQVVYYFASGDTYINILLVFACAILLIYTLQNACKAQQLWKQTLWLALLIIEFIVVAGLNQKLTIGYGFWGIMTPVYASLPLKEKESEQYRILLLGVSLLCMALNLGGVQWYGLVAVPILLLYNGQRGKANLKYFFYIFYPVHLAVLQGIVWLLG